jgi:hypothetical protein
LNCKKKLDDNESFLYAEVLSDNIKVTVSHLQIIVKALYKEEAPPKGIKKVATASYQLLKYIKPLLRLFSIT